MKRIYLLLLPISLCVMPMMSYSQDVKQNSDSSAKNGFVREKVANRQTNVGTYVNGEKDGIWRTYSDKDILRGVVEYDMGVKDGVELIFDRQGFVSEENYYKDGKLNGEVREYLRGNYIQKIANYVDGELDGVYRTYYSDKPSIMMEESFYVNGLKDGKSTYFAQSGRAIAEYTYSNGMFNGVNKTYYDSGNLKTVETYANDVLQGKYCEYYEDGKTLKIKGEYKDGLKEGLWYEYSPNGSEINKTKFSEGEEKGSGKKAKK